jgi:trans-aconitate methyltransferase
MLRWIFGSGKSSRKPNHRRSGVVLSLEVLEAREVPTATPYVVPTIPNVTTQSILTVGESAANGYRMAGIPDVRADLTSCQFDRPLDILFSNAALQWVSGHGALLTRFHGMLAPGGVLAVQMPWLDMPAHHALEAVQSSERWRNRLFGIGLAADAVHPLRWYVERLLALGFSVDAWETTYWHVLTGADPIVEWYKGSALRPLLQALPAGEHTAFLHDVASAFTAAYPKHGETTLFPFPRIFFVATKTQK